ncbi:MAG: bifunctional folylpolyglutamate synthase/dihydrofolate synthase [Candidatus Omnitrophica bacterium]|nr:bifunctional folylpolyglutamate synthase/dihydrofolate synthase [Candidatus Omnitrophota bacterium]
MSFVLEEYLNSFTNWEARLGQAQQADFGLERVEKLLGAFGRPDDRVRFVHVAGSKGKGSTCAFLAHILRAAGYRVGLYTSPHLNDVRERIRVLEPRGAEVAPAAGHDPFEGMISVEEMIERVRFYQEPVDRLRNDEGVPVTYFEYLTALAVSYFAARKVDVAVLETGLGGRLDATSAVDAMVCGITPLGLEHTAILGNTLEQIAAEKAGIIRAPSQKVVCAPQPEAAMAVIRARCRSFGITPTVVGRDMALSVRSQGVDGVTFDVTGRREYRGLVTQLAGEHQALNAAVALAMVEDLEMFGFMLTEEAAAQGIRETVWPARFEVLGERPRFVLDCAHTRESAAAFAATFRTVFPGRKAVLIFGASSDKDLAALAGELVSVAGQVVLARASHPRACDLTVSDGERLFPGVSVCRANSAGEAVEMATRLVGTDGLVAVTGSVFLCAEARRTITGSAPGADEVEEAHVPV